VLIYRELVRKLEALEERTQRFKESIAKKQRVSEHSANTSKRNKHSEHSDSGSELDDDEIHNWRAKRTRAHTHTTNNTSSKLFAMVQQIDAE
jgi:hypothetical protein